MVDLLYLEEYDNIVTFALELIKASKSRGEGAYSERIAILHLDHANELLMKSFLRKKGFIIDFLTESEIKKGVKKEEIMEKDRTLSYVDSLKLVSKVVGFSQEKMDEIMKFHRLRNEVQHRAINLPLDKGEKIDLFLPRFKELYDLMFPEYEEHFPV